MKGGSRGENRGSTYPVGGLVFLGARGGNHLAERGFVCSRGGKGEAGKFQEVGREEWGVSAFEDTPEDKI